MEITILYWDMFGITEIQNKHLKFVQKLSGKIDCDTVWLLLAFLTWQPSYIVLLTHQKSTKMHAICH